MKTDDEKSFRLFSDKKTGENLSFSRASIYFGRKREREREKSVVAGCFRQKRVLLSALFFLSLSSLSRLSNKEVQKRERRTFPIRHFIKP